MIKFYDVTESSLDRKAFEAENLYFCNDTGAIYLDSKIEKTRIRIASDIIILATESARTSLLAPISNKIYCVLGSGRLYIYSDGNWISLGGAGSQIVKSNIEVPNSGTLTITDDNIKSYNTGKFYPDLSVSDLASNISVVCADGSATITLTASYPIIGNLVID